METIGKYQVQRVLGHGAMGTVYEAMDPVIQRKVALKTMNPGLAEDPDLKVRFLREAQAAGGLRHRNIVTVYDLGEDKGRPYIAMEFIEGTDLEKIIQDREPLSMEWKLDVLRQICEGLAYAHRNGIVHRDVKPANVRVTPEGEVKIMDFGIAHLQSSNLTKSGLVMGTVHYMAPEQIEGHKVDHRADVFSVGVITYELLAYKKAFDGESITAVMYKIIHERPDPKALPASEYSPGLERIVMKALAKKLEERYQSLDGMLADLVGLMHDTAPKLMMRPPVKVDREAETVTLAVDLDKEKERRRGLVAQLVQEGDRALGGGQTDKARDCAKQALALLPDDPAAKSLALEAESEALRKRVEREMAEMRAEVEEARAAGQLQRALTLCQKLLELNPEDGELARMATEIKAAIQDKQVEELSSQALAYATDGDLDLALKIAGRIERLAPQSPKYLELKAYLEEESVRRKATALTAAAQEHLAHGNLVEAQAAAEEALSVLPSDTLAREIRDRVAGILAVREKQAPPAVPVAVARPAAAPPAAPASPPPAPRPKVAARVAPSAPPAGAAAPAVTLPPAVSAPPKISPPKVSPPPKAAPPAPVPRPVAAPAAPPAPVPAAAAPPIAPARAASLTAVAAAPVPRVGSEISREAAPLTPLPEGEPENAEAASLLDTARRHLRDRAPQRALPFLEQAAGLDPEHAGIQRLLKLTRLEARRAEAEALTTSALNYFVQNKYAKARQAVEKALSLEPENRKAKELVKILVALG